VPVPYADLTDPQSLNQYTYVRNIPTAKIDVDGHDGCCGLSAVWDFFRGTGNAYASDNLAGALRNDQGGAAYHMGQALGDGAAMVQGFVETALSTVGEGVGIGLDATGVGAPAGVAVNVVSTAGIVHGSTTFVNAGQHLLKSSSDSSGGSNLAPKEGETGGPGAGKDFSDKTKTQAVDQNKAANGGKAKCVFCGEPVGPGTKNKTNIDHATAKANNGNNSLNNANVACEYCNKSKGKGDAPKNQKNKDQN
jgi:hypothetical protein